MSICEAGQWGNKQLGRVAGETGWTAQESCLRSAQMLKQNVGYTQKEGTNVTSESPPTSLRKYKKSANTNLM